MNLMVQLLILLFTLTSEALVGGEKVQNVPGLVRITFTNGWVCSGLFLNATTVLTAAHCLPEKGEVQKFSDSDEIQIPVKAVKLIPHPDFQKQIWHSSDVGIIKTSIYAGFRKSYPLGKSASGKSILYGCGRTNPEKMEYACTQGENSFVRIGKILFFTGGKACVAPNDSGGPVIENDKVIGIMSTSYVNPCFSSGTAITEENKDFVEREMN